jgi:hypothetical protein
MNEAVCNDRHVMAGFGSRPPAPPMLRRQATRLLLFLLLLPARSSPAAPAPPTGDGSLPYDRVLFVGTHNSAINLGAHSLGRPAAAIGGRHPSAAASAYQYPVMDQRLSVRDQLEQGIRFLDLEIAAITGGPFGCPAAQQQQCQATDPHHCQRRQRPQEHMLKPDSGQCLSCCPFIVSHGSVQESVGDRLGYTFPEDVFVQVAEFVAAHRNEVVSVLSCWALRGIAAHTTLAKWFCTAECTR